MKYKLICLDMDGTLLSSPSTISEENRNAVLQAYNKGIKIAITTGRLFTSAKYYADLIGIKVPIVASNGAYVREKDREEVIYKSSLNDDQLRRIYEVIKKYDLLTYFNTHDTLISESVVGESHGYKVNNKELPEERRIKFDEGTDFKEAFKRHEGEILKAICVEEADIDRLMKAKAELRQYKDLEVVSSWTNNFEVMNAGTSKGNAVKNLAEMLGIKQEEIICIGDSENDLSMIRYAGLGIAMGNAPDEIKKEADYVTDTNVNSGVAKAIEKFVL
ncbi:Cof-type HAD-IIB family hydrolase [Clostridium fungisolvens]|uniref:5-amino-6-(5-phospho-D-ribitylamino)uracil phosphatase YcsE n=1 Tax=Clostridium fungisolvens TaxID=1604897 RepID=A0A6V8SH10_9CLOT|nr:Cof-type HAD-IIB family hydrolase [Clostridium fungisolvens]GFP74163.1 5-amino-6-(5-phospho-D-ribitylamino)uracil phosphatase YcsE [Clostridium fungisolvens]